VAACPDRHLHVIDLPYRLGSPAFLHQEIRLWEDEAGNLAGFAVWHPAFRMLDYGFDPRVGQMADRVLDWVQEWFAARANQAGSPQTCWVKIQQDDREWTVVLEARGFTRCAWSLAHLEVEAPVADRVAEAFPLQERTFHIREVGPHDDDAWVELHRAIFPNVGMTAEWRREMTRAATYRRELDLIVVDSDATPAALCVGWLGSIGTERVGQIEPLGTHPAYRGQRLGRVVLLEVVRRLREHGARRVMVETWDDNRAAIHSYETAGFRQTASRPTYARDFT